ncbi:dermonecrotic toxin domain-containing protein [Pseudomonas mucidolens]|uniref:Dermonecrotic toxin N-terminal domain-containing protein n=1 Tax=Pseudomonas mucidolens TaxID=46679 RepID=A0A1H2NLL7_9PSED|nr:DUF6543 domain-containing protein [Pseudomonas mucidolens]SDV06290.1 hypothetical protein SAMN05216202_4070 [Pseudomonas mucidolens]SQH31615.1 leucine rich repeat domain protein [Pseudomonas mucidolens]
MHTPVLPPANSVPPVSPLAIHQAFIKRQLPAWLTQAPAAVLKDFRSSLIASNQSRHDLKALLDQLQSPAAFARPLLREAFKDWWFGFTSNESSVLVREWKNHYLLGLIRTHARTTRQTLLEAALQNFEAAEAEEGGMESGTAIYDVTQAGQLLSAMPPGTFASGCRKLDLGSQYLAHISSVLEPAPTSGSTYDATQVRETFAAQARHAFGVALHIAFMRRQLSACQYLLLQLLQRAGSHLHIKCSQLTINRVVLPNVLVIQAPTVDLPFLLYTPEDPTQSLRRHTSMDDLKQRLAERLLKADYQSFFNHLVPLQHQGSLLKVIPAHLDEHDFLKPWVILPARLEHRISLTLILGELFLNIAERRIAQIKSDARTLVIPTADADLISREKRLQRYADLGQSLLFFAASFIPIVGQALLIITAAQVIGTVYDGFSAWSRGDSDEALNDLFDLLDNATFAAVTAGALKTAGFTAGLIKVQLRGKGLRLWNPELTPYRYPKALPNSLIADEQGLYRHEQQHFLQLDDQLHLVKPTPDGKQWELAHPTDPQAYSPPLLTNGTGAWRHLHETPQTWDSLKLLKRLGPDAATITEPMVEPILLLGGADNTTLREIHQQMLRPPPLLRDTLKHFNLDQEINGFNLDQAAGATVSHYSPLIQFHLLTSLPEWPADYSLKVVNEQKDLVLGHGTGAKHLEISESRFRLGLLLHEVGAKMPQAEFNNLLASPYIDYFTKIENLALRLEKQATTQKHKLLAWLVGVDEQALSATEKNIRALAPNLSKSHLEELERTLTEQEQQHLQSVKCLPAVQQLEAGQYGEAIQANRASTGIFLDSLSTDESLPLTLYTLEQVPGWPDSRKIDVYEGSRDGRLLGSTGSSDANASHVLIRQGELYAAEDPKGQPLNTANDLSEAVERTLSLAERQAILEQSSVTSLKQAIHKTSLSLMTQEPPPIRAMPSLAEISDGRGLPLDPLFAEPVPPTALTLQSDGLYQTPPLPDGSYRHYIHDQQKYYQVKYDRLGWRLLDARSRFRAYQPYLRKTAEGRWEIDQSRGALLGGSDTKPQLPTFDKESSDEYDSTHSSSTYMSTEEGVVQTAYTEQELRHMRSVQGYQYSQNYRRIYDRANNGRYPLRDMQGRPMRIKSIQSQARSLTSGVLFGKELVLPYIQWEGYEAVANLYEDKLEVTPFTAAHQRFAQEFTLIGQATVITRRPLTKGEALGVYGGEVLPLWVAMHRQDPYLMQIKPLKPAPPRALNTQLVLSGDNALSRINTIFDYDADSPVRQAAGGYNVEAARFNVKTQTGTEQPELLALTALFASADIPAGAELRWNYQYDEATINLLFPRPAHQ